MDIVIASLAFAVSMLAAGLMGFAIQRGGTCTVAAVEELLTRRRATRLVAMAEASLWVAGALVLAQTLHRLPVMPSAHAITLHTVPGAVLLGLGAWLGQACVFGAIARLGSGQWAYLATPVGFYLGALCADRLFARPGTDSFEPVSPLLQAPGIVAGLFIAFTMWRLLPPLWAGLRREASVSRSRGRHFAERVWAPHAATGVIGITFVVVLLAVGSAWTYTDVLADLAHAMAGSLAARMLLLLALLAGAICGGWTAGRLAFVRPTPAALLRCLAGGALMGCGSLLIPGGNDGLILVGMPLLWPYAWLAFATMCVSIAAAMKVQASIGLNSSKRSTT